MRRTAIRAGAFAAAFLAVYAATVLTPVGQQLDAASLGAFSWVPAWVHGAASPLRVAVTVTAGAVSIVILADLLLKRRFVLAGRALAAGILTLGLSEFLKQVLLPRPFFGHFGYDSNTFPSGHVAITAVVIAIVSGVAPRSRRDRWRRRTLVLVLVVAALAEPISFAHRASDAVGGVLLAGMAVSLCWPLPPSLPLRGYAAATLAAAVLILIAALAHAPVVLGPAVALLLWLAAAGLLGGATVPRSLGVSGEDKSSEKTSTRC